MDETDSKNLLSLHIIFGLASFIRFSRLSRFFESNQSLSVEIPKMISKYRKTSFTLNDGMSEWKGNGGLLMVHTQEDIIGMLRIDAYRTFYSISSVIVNPIYRGNGYSNVLMNVIKGLDKPVHLRVRQHNEPAINLYSKHGFKILEPCEDRYLMRLKMDF